MPAPRRFCAILALLLVGSASVAAALPPGPAAAAAWPSSPGLVLAEIVTGGSSASDEYVEITNAGPVAADLGGCELIYVTASGATTTRKALFASPLLLVPGQHLLVANAAGIYGSLADATYSGGMASEGGVVALKISGGSVIDALGWGTAANQYVEGAVAPAPPAKSSLERRPGGPDGNTVDTNDNQSDWFIQSNPIPQSLASTPTGGATPTPTSSVSASTTASASSPTGVPTLEPSATASPPAPATTEPTATASSSPTPLPTTDSTASSAPTAETTTSPPPSASPSAAAPTATATATATASFSPSPTGQPSASPTPTQSRSPSPAPSVPALISIADARVQAVGVLVHVIGVVTIAPGLTGTEGLFAIEDSSGGMFIRWTGSGDGIVPGAEAEAVGVLAVPYGQLEIRELSRLTVGPQGDELTPARAELSAIGEGTEARLVTVRGTVQSVTTDSGRLTIVIDDGSAGGRVAVDPLIGLSHEDVARGDVILATGVVGQRASALGLADGYKVWLRTRSDLLVRPTIETAAPESPQPDPVATSTVTSVLHDLSSLSGRRGSAIDVEATVTATAGLLDINGPTIVLDDGTGAAAVVLPADAEVPGVGMRVHVTGKVGSWEGGPTILATRVESEGELRVVEPYQVTGALGELDEWRLAWICGRIQRVTHAGTRWRVEILVNGQVIVVLGEPAAGISVASSSVDRLAIVTGIVRRSTSNSAEFQLLPRSPLDMRVGPASVATGDPAITAGEEGASVSVVAAGSGGPGDGAISISSLESYVGLDVTVVGLVTATAAGEVTIDDGTGEVRIGGSGASEALSLLEPGDAVEVRGKVAEDDRGLVIIADATSIVVLPGGDAAASHGPQVVLGLVAGNAAASTPPTLGAAASIRKVSATAPLPDAQTLLVAVTVLLVGAVVCLGATRRWHEGAARPSSVRRLVGLAQLSRLLRIARTPRLR